MWQKSNQKAGFQAYRQLSNVVGGGPKLGSSKEPVLTALERFKRIKKIRRLGLCVTPRMNHLVCSGRNYSTSLPWSDLVFPFYS